MSSAVGQHRLTWGAVLGTLWHPNLGTVITNRKGVMLVTSADIPSATKPTRVVDVSALLG